MKEIGYQFGSRQPLNKISISFTLPDNLFAEKLDQWLEDAFEAQPGEYKPTFLNNVAVDSGAQNYLTRLLQITTVLLQDIYVPIFERAVVVDINVDPNQRQRYKAHLWFPVSESFPQELFNSWLCLSQELIHTFCAFSDNVDSLENYYQKFNQEHVKTWVKRIPSGKSTIPILQSAFDLGIPFLHLGNGRYLIGWGSQSRIFDRSSNNLDSNYGASASHNKHVAKTIMQQSGIPTPAGIYFNTDQKIQLTELKHLGTPLVVKPADRDRGEGVTLNIKSTEQLLGAVELAKKITKNILIEKHIPGTCHRVLVVENKIIYVVKRNPKAVIGDGVSDIETLVFHANAAIRKKIPRKRLPEFYLDEEALVCLKSVGLNTKSILDLGEKAYLRYAQSTQWGGDPEEITHLLHPDNAEICMRAAASLKLNCAGVDFISTDISVPWHQNNAVINEVNFAPVMGRTYPYQRHATHEYLKQIFPHSGHIPIRVFFGQETQELANQAREDFIRLGQRCYFVSDNTVVNFDGNEVHMADQPTIFNKVKNLRSCTSMDALVIHSNHHDIFKKTGYPFEEVLLDI
jgi:cyanophycin synthetase